MNTLFEIKPEMRVLSLWQPWASLLVHGIKKIETRPGPTSWTAEKGIYLIHAAQKWTKEQKRICLQEPFRSELIKLGYIVDFINEETLEKVWIPMLPLGCIIGAIEVTKCYPIWNNPIFHPFPLKPKIYKGTKDHVALFEYIQEPELSFGDYTDGRYAWLTKNPRVLKTPIPYRGGQGYYQKFKGDTNQLIFI